MFGVRQWSVRLCWLGVLFERVTATAPTTSNRISSEKPPLELRTLTSDPVPATILNNEVSIDAAVYDYFDQNRSAELTAPWLNTTSSGRGLRQTDQIFQQNLLLVGCRAGAPDGAAARLKRLVTQVRLNLKIVIREAEKGVDSQFGFETFFKTNDNIPRVLEIFKNIANGDKLRHLRPNQRLSWLMYGKGNPIVGCALTAKEKVNHKAYLECQNPPRYAYQPLGSAWIFLCPEFWQAPKAPSTSHCPELHFNGSFTTPADVQLHMNQQTIFVHELVHLYLGLSFQASIVEQYTIGAVTELSSDKAVENASNYGYFYAAVLAACMRWPH